MSFLFRVAAVVAPLSGAATKTNTENIFASGDTTAVKSLTQPIQYSQRLLVCNACPGWEGVEISRNGAATTSGASLAFNECRHVEGKLYPEDRIGFKFPKESVEGTFAIDTLPQSDSQLLLIVQRRGKDDLVSFQSFAFPAAQNDQAQVAFLNTIPDDPDTRVRMSDIKSSGSARREEEVLFNRVYGVEAGAYDVSDEKDTDKKRALPIHLARSGEYVVLKTGTKEHSQLVVFPSEPEHDFLRKMLYVVALLGPIFAMALVMNMVRARKADQAAGAVEGSDDEKTELVV